VTWPPAAILAIQRSEIDAFQPSPNSLMPVGFEKQIKPEGFADLLAFLTKRGKYVPPSRPCGAGGRCRSST
jgi:hypothetical protein